MRARATTRNCWRQRWSGAGGSGAPLALAPDADDPALAADSMRNNDFSYANDPKGLRCPLGSHIRRTNPRDGLQDSIVNPKIHRILRRGAAYGPVLPGRRAGR